MSIIERLFSSGMREIEAHTELLDNESELLFKQVDKANKQIDKAVDPLLTMREAIETVKGNIVWLEIELDHSKQLLSYKETAELFEAYDSNQDTLRHLKHIIGVRYLGIKADTQAVVNEFQDVIDEYEAKVEQLEALVDTHATKSNRDDLLEIVDKYYIVHTGQVTKINNKLAEHEIEIELR